MTEHLPPPTNKVTTPNSNARMMEMVGGEDPGGGVRGEKRKRFGSEAPNKRASCEGGSSGSAPANGRAGAMQD